MLRRITMAAMNAVPANVASHMRSDSPLARIARPIVNRAVASGYSYVSVRAGEGRGLELLIDPTREKYYWTGMHEPEVQAELRRLAKPGDVVWDVGGHIGFFALMAARLVTPGEVHVFEPIEGNRVRLAKNIERNRIGNVRIQPFALAAQEGEGTLLDRESSLMWSLVSGSSDQGISVHCTTLDAMSAVLPLPDLIKVDAEEAEVEVLKGGLKLLHDQAPKLIVEFTNETLVNEARELLPDYHFDQFARRHWLLEKER